MARVELISVSKTYPGGTRAVDRLDLSVGDGELMVLVGPSGCGKTTALRMVAGLEEITEGEVRLGDRVINDVAPKDRDIAMVFQSYALYPHLTVEDNIGFGLRLRKVAKAEIRRRVREVARSLDLEDLLARRPRQLSGGQRQRVAMGRAIVRQPQAFLMDEPLSNLDAKLRVQMRAEISRLQADLGVTTIYVTHDQTEAMTLGDRVAVLRKGVLQQVDAPQVLYDAPVNLFVAGFIGSPAMNLVQGEVIVTDGRSWLVLGDQKLSLPAAVARRLAVALGEVGAGTRVAVGIRPEDMEDAALTLDMTPDIADASRPPSTSEEATGWETVLRSRADLVEALGSELYVHFTIEAPVVVSEETTELAAEIGTEALGLVRGEQAQRSRAELTARFSPRSTVRAGQPISVRVDTDRLHFFDLASGSSLAGPGMRDHGGDGGQPTAPGGRTEGPTEGGIP